MARLTFTLRVTWDPPPHPILALKVPDPGGPSDPGRLGGWFPSEWHSS